MQFKPYPEYKDSGVEWLGEVPASWKVTALKRLGRIQTGNTPPTDNASYYSEATKGIPWVKPENLNGFTPITKTEKYLSVEGVKLGRVVGEGSVLVCCIASIGKMGVAGTQLATNQQINSITFNKQVSPCYGMYVLSSTISEHERLANGNVVRILNTEKQGGINLCVPPINEQEKIIFFLDQETSKIDLLISKQEKLIQLLEEQRKSIISHAVTKGLNPDVPMKDSGVEWLGEVPAHWAVVQLKNMAIGFVNGTAAEQLLDGESDYKVSRIETISNGYINYQKVGYLKTDFLLERYKLQNNDFLISHINSFEKVGNSAIYNGEYPLWHGMNLVRITPKIDSFHNYLKYFLKSDFFIASCRKLCKPAINQVSLTTSHLKSLPITRPLYAEQKAITNFLDRETSKIDTAIDKQKQLIEKLKEYRSSIISHAVTGKIDVRDLAA